MGWARTPGITTTSVSGLVRVLMAHSTSHGWNTSTSSSTAMATFGCRTGLLSTPRRTCLASPQNRGVIWTTTPKIPGSTTTLCSSTWPAMLRMWL